MRFTWARYGGKVENEWNLARRVRIVGMTRGVSWCASVFVSRGVMLDYGVKTTRHGMGHA